MTAPSDKSGLTLKLARIKAGLRVCDVADEMAVSHQRITAIEGLRRVRPELAERFRAALNERLLDDLDCEVTRLEGERAVWEHERSIGMVPLWRSDGSIFYSGKVWDARASLGKKGGGE